MSAVLPPVEQTNANLLPRNSEPWERCVADAMSIPLKVRTAIGLVPSAKWVSRPPSFLPFLIYELGLGELTPYVPNLYSLIDDGVDWQRLRGTLSAVDMGLAWIGYSAAIEPAWHERTFWNSFQLRFTTLPKDDDPDLTRIEGIASLSAPRRSKLRRGVFQYDVGALVADISRLDHAILDFESGIKATAGTIVFPEGAIWSFGRTHEFEHTLTEAEGLAIGNWIEPVEGGIAPWIDMSFPWVDYVAPWAATPEEQRRANLAGWFSDQVLYAVLRDQNDSIIGYRRCRAARPVNSAFDGGYRFGTAKYDPAIAGTSVYIEAMTQFDDADSVTAKRVSLLVGGALAVGTPAGRLWLQPGSISGGHEICTKTTSVPLRKTVRDQFKFLLGF